MKNRKINETLKNNAYAFGLVWKIAPRSVILLISVNTYHTIMFFFEHIYVYKFVIDCIQYKRPFIYVVYYMIGLFVITTIYSRFLDWYYRHGKITDDININKRLQYEIYGKAAGIDMIKYDDTKYYDDYIWVVEDIKTRIINSYMNIVEMLEAAVTLAVYGTFIATSDPVIIAVLFSTIWLGYLINLKLNKLNYKYNMELKPSVHKREYVKRVFYMQDYVNELKMNNINGRLRDINREAAGEAAAKIKKIAPPRIILSFIQNYLLDDFIYDGFYVLYLSYRAVVLKTLGFGTVAALIRSLWQFKGGINKLITGLPKMNENSLYIKRYRDFMSQKPEIKCGAEMLEDERIRSLELKSISFSYDGSEKILKNISMKINKNEKIAIVGYNGAGKSTLSNIIMRLYEYDSGEMLINDRLVRTIDTDAYRRRISAVFQEFYIYAATLRENITLDAVADEERLIRAVELSGLSDKIKSLEKGLDTVLTREFDDEGVLLSGGEIQKVALARAIYRKSDIIIMDEPSSALDPMSELHLNQTIMDIADDRIVLFISHRLSTTKIADRIFYIENGEIAEHGTHAQLMEQNGHYARMFEIQAKKYNVD